MLSGNGERQKSPGEESDCYQSGPKVISSSRLAAGSAGPRAFDMGATCLGHPA